MFHTVVVYHLSNNMEAEHVCTHLETLKADSETCGETKFMEIVSNDPHTVHHVPVSDMNQEPMVSTSSNMGVPNVETSVSDTLPFKFEPEAKANYLQSSFLVDSQSLMPQLQPPVSYQSYVERAAAARSIPGALRLPRKRKTPPESTLSGSTSEKLGAPNERIEPIHHKPWLDQFYFGNVRPGYMPSSTLSPTAEHPTSGRKLIQIEPVFQKSGKQVMNKKQTGLSQGITKTQNNGNELLRSKMKESLAAALALVQEQEETLKEKKNSETEEASVPVAEDITPALSTRDESSGHKDGNGRILFQETSNDTNMNYVNQSDVQKTQFDEVFLRDDAPFSDSFFSSDELLHGNGLSWVLESPSDLGEKGTCGVKSFEDPNLLASKIELELFKLFGGVNKKYKEKGRSLLFNLKDKNNPELRESVMSGKISPERLCSMTAEELASKELSQWRQAKAEEMAEMVVLRDADIDVSRLVRKTHKGEFQVEIDDVDSVPVDTSAGITSLSKPRAKAKSLKSSNSGKSNLKKTDSNDKNTKTEHGAEETDPKQGLSVDDEMKDVGFLPPIVSLDEFMDSLNSETPLGSPHENHLLKEESSSDKSDSEVKSHSKSPKQSPKEPCEKLSPKSELEKSNVTSSKLDGGVKLDVEVSKPEKVPLVDSIEEDRIWDGILQLSSASLVSVTGIFKRQVSYITS